MGGKTGTTKQSVSIPPEVMERYNAVNAYASDIAKTPFQGYQGQFVAGLTPTQQAGIQATSAYSQAAQPYYQAATGQLYGAQQSAMPGMSAAYQNVGGAQNVGEQYAQQATRGIGAALDYAQPFQQGATQAAMAGAQQLTPENINIQGYMSPYTQAVADTTYQALRQQQQQEMAGQTANAIRAGAFGGDRAGLVAANLARQQQLGTAQAMAPIYQQGYSQALGTATNMAQANRAALQNLSQQLQGIGQAGYGQQMGAAQQLAGLGQQQFGQGMGAAAQLAGLAQQGYGMGAQTAQQLAALGTGAQQSALQGAQAQLGAGTLEQQTQQADLTAQYQQFLQERGYPFQVAQFLANIAMGTGALSGQTTTTTQPMPFFSDRRVKEDVKEIGETHDGQPIYSFKYKGDDATRIGLMAQDVEKKHPEAVYDMGGVKGVDYKQATESAERPEKYHGGLVPASMGGAVTDAPAFGRQGYAFRGGVDASDLQQILAQQREAMGPYAEGGIYGVSQHGAPFESANAIVPKQRLHIPSMRDADEPPPMPEGAGSQAIKLFDETMAMKNRYDAAKDLLRTPQEKVDQTRTGQTGTSRENLAGFDIVPDKKPEEKGILENLASMFGYAEGGVVPRHGYALGAYVDPYEKAKGYFPEESLEESGVKELKKAGETPQSTSQTGLSLGDAASLAKTFILPFFLKDGGLVPRGHLQTGGVYDPTLLGTGKSGMVNASELTPEKIAELNKEDIYSRELQPAAAPRFRVFERIAAEEGAKGVKPIELYRSPERSAMLDLTMPEGAPRAKPYQSGHNYRLAVDYSGTTPENYDAIRKAAAATGLTSGLDFKNIDPPHVQLGKGGYGGLYGKDVVIDEGFGQRSQSGVVPAEAQEAAYAAARKTASNLPSTKAVEASGQGKGVLPSVNKFLSENQAWLSPLGAGLKGMFQSKSPFLGAAIGEGIGAGLEAIGPAQTRLADIGLTQAQTFEAGSRIPPGYVYIGTDENGRPMFALRSEMLADMAKSPTEDLAETQRKIIEESKIETSGEPIVSSVTDGKYNYVAQPTENADKKFVSLGYTGNPNDKFRIQDRIAASPDLMKLQNGEAKLFEDRKELAKNTAAMRQDLNMLNDAIFGISKEGLTSIGPGQASRARLVALWNWSVDNAGLDAQKIKVGSDISNAQIIEKLRASAGIVKAGPAGFHAASVAQAINDAQPSGELDEEASRKLMASMMVQNQMPEDFTKYGDTYASKYGGLLYADNSFREDVGQRYEFEKKALADAMIPVKMPDGTYKSRIQWLRENPGKAMEFENYYKLPGLARLALGG